MARRPEQMGIQEYQDYKFAINAVEASSVRPVTGREITHSRELTAF